MARATALLDALGGAKTVHSHPRTADEFHTAVLKGLPYGTVEALIRNYDLDKKTLLSVLDIPERTLARRKQEARLQPLESDRLARIARIAALAEETFGSREKASRWLQRPNRALGGATPFLHLSTELGARQVEDVLGRIAHGSYS